ncbi:unnamed protein product [Mycena citricolor]|uniref:Uncharacterized protein n=1 Tax=Mycena citricolor TaxID=2018698 RepID=A0AAD2JWC0_9AGAR|nr:unnamed protein product [Mycena citricolor]
MSLPTIPKRRTRQSSANTTPIQTRGAAGLKPHSAQGTPIRRLPETVAQERQAEEKRKEAAETLRQRKVQAVADVADELYAEDKLDASHAQRRSAASLAPTKNWKEMAQTAVTSEDEENLDPGADDDMSDIQDPLFAAPGSDASDEDEDSGDDEEDKPTNQKKGPKTASKLTRKDVEDKRTKRKASVTSDAQPHKESKRGRITKKSGLVSASRATSSASGRSSAAGANAEDDHMFQFGGMEEEDDKFRADAPAVKNKANQSIVNVSQPKALSKKAQRGGGNKWQVKDLPAAARSKFSDDLVPLLKGVMGTLEDPWESPSLDKKQSLVNAVYGPGKYIVAVDNVWFDLMDYRSGGYRSGMAGQARKAFEEYIKMLGNMFPSEQPEPGKPAQILAVSIPPAPASSTTTEPHALGTAPNETVDNSHMDSQMPGPDANATPTTVAVPAPNVHSRSGRAALVTALTKVHGSTKCFMWEKWENNGESKSGFLFSFLIQYTFAYYLDSYHSLAQTYGNYLSSARPVGALLLAIQAVDHTLGCWKTGDFVSASRKDWFSEDNYADIVGKDSRSTAIKIVTRRATRYLKTVKLWDDEKWDQFLSDASEWQARKKHDVPKFAVADEGEELASEEEVLILSD